MTVPWRFRSNQCGSVCLSATPRSVSQGGIDVPGVRTSPMKIQRMSRSTRASGPYSVWAAASSAEARAASSRPPPVTALISATVAFCTNATRPKIKSLCLRLRLTRGLSRCALPGKHERSPAVHVLALLIYFCRNMRDCRIVLR